MARAAALPWSMAAAAGALVLAGAAVENLMYLPGQLSPWTPLAMLAGTGLLFLALRVVPRLPAAPGRPATRAEPPGAVVLVVVALVAIAGYTSVRLLGAGLGLPAVVASAGMPLVAAAAAGAVALYAARLGGAGALAAAGALGLAGAAVLLAGAAADLGVRQLETTHLHGVEMSVAVEVAGDTDRWALLLTAGDRFAVTVLMIVGLALVVAGWWWAAVRRGGYPASVNRPT